MKSTTIIEIGKVGVGVGAAVVGADTKIIIKRILLNNKNIGDN